MALFEKQGEDVLEQLRELAYDPFAPIVIINPVAGFPKQFQTESGSGLQVTLDTRDRLQNFVLTDNDTKMDQLDLTFIDDEGVFADPDQLVHGAVIDVAWGYKGRMSQPRRLIVRRLQLGIVQGRQYARRRRGFMVTIEGLAPAVIQNTKAPAGDDFFADKPLATIVRTIAERLGFHEEARGEHRLDIRIPHDQNVSEPVISRPRSMTYPQFLQMLADKYDMVFQIRGTGLFFGTRDADARPNYVIDLNGTTLLGIDLDGDLVLGIPAGLALVGYSPGDQKLINVEKKVREKDRKKGSGPTIAKVEEDTQEATEVQAPGLVEPPPGLAIQGQSLIKTGAAKGRRVLNVTHNVMEDFRPTTTTRQASDIIRGFTNRIKKAWRIRIKLVGDPDIVAGKNVLLQNFGTALLDGTWFVTEARHRIQDAYITELLCRRHVGTKNQAAGRIVKRNVDKTSRNKDDEKKTFAESKNVEGTSLFRLRDQTPVAPETSRSTTGTYTEHEYRPRGN
jgi:hypothetical protein